MIRDSGSAALAYTRSNVASTPAPSAGADRIAMSTNTLVKIEETAFQGYAAVRLATPDLAVLVVPDVGGRILSVKHRGEELFFAHEQHLGEPVDVAAARDLAAEKKRLGFRLWGGDKTWIAPQSAWTQGIPPLDLDAGRYTWRHEGKAIVMESPICRETHLKVVRRVELFSNGDLLLDEKMTNAGKRETTRGLWDVTQMLRPFDVYLPVPLAGVRGYPDEGDSVAIRDEMLVARDGWTCVPCREPRHFKFGGLAERGVVVALRPAASETLAHVRRFDIQDGSAYAHDASVEVYNSPSHDYLEVEVHAPLKTLAPGAFTQHRQTWRFGRLPAGIGPDEALLAMG